MEKYALAKSTPMMAQWFDIKKTLTDEIVFCRVGDFYELFYDDAEIASKALDIQLTKRKIGKSTYPMAGVPHRSLDNYISRLINQGYKVAIIDQLEDAKQSKGKKTIKRGLTRIVTRGTVTDETMLTPGKNNYLGALAYKKVGKKYQIGFSVCDLSTGDFRAGTFDQNQKNELLCAYNKFSPVEIIYEEDVEDPSTTFTGLQFDNDELLTSQPNYWFEMGYASQVVYNQFNVKTVKGFGLEENSLGVGAAGALIKYLQETQFTDFPHISVIRSLDIKDTLTLDVTAIRGLELFNNAQDQSTYGTLMSLINETITPMGSRLLRHWLANPLANRKQIEQRLSSVSLFIDDSLLQHSIRSILTEIGDIERLITRISMKTARPDELVKLASSLERIPLIREKLIPLVDHFPENLIESIDPSFDVVTLIRNSIFDEPSSNISAGFVIKYGYNSELDHLREILKEGKAWIDNFIEKEKQRSGISNLKIKSNNVFGYFIEISKRELDKVPSDYIQKQAMVNVTRYFSETLKKWETEVLEAEIKTTEIEEKIYSSILKELSQFVNPLQATSLAIAQIDCLSAFAYLAERRAYCKPEFNNGKSFIINGARHPVIEALNSTQVYVPNDVHFDYERQRIIIVTGPNYSGKSSLLRAIALIAIMAQMGSYVPANNVDMGIIDRIFTRIGASDNLVAGQSTFLMEMIDAANLVNNSTDRSLVIADEIGRGTSTYDGLAIAWSIAEYLHNNKQPPKTLIATHYHQLAELEGLLNACRNFQFIIRFEGEKPIFDHKLERGSSDKSFGVEVAKLSGLPDPVIKRAKQILEILESKAAKVTDKESSQRLVDLVIAADGQTSLGNWFEESSTLTKEKGDIQKRGMQSLLIKDKLIITELKNVDIESLTPVDALNLLAKLKEKIE